MKIERLKRLLEIRKLQENVARDEYLRCNLSVLQANKQTAQIEDLITKAGQRRLLSLLSGDADRSIGEEHVVSTLTGALGLLKWKLRNAQKRLSESYGILTIARMDRAKLEGLVNSGTGRRSYLELRQEQASADEIFLTTRKS